MKKGRVSINRPMLIGLGVSLAFWLYNFIAISQNTQILYLFLWLAFGGGAVYYFQEALTRKVNSPKGNIAVRFFAAGYAMVLFEEIFAALVNNISEGFTIMLFLERILQFWAFNLFAFSGMFVAWFLLRQYFLYSNKEVFYVTGIFGVYVELLSKGIHDTFSLILLIIPMIFVYGLIVTPMALVSMPGKVRLESYIVRYLVPLLFIFLSSLPFMYALDTLRCAHPNLFPPAHFIPEKTCHV